LFHTFGSQLICQTYTFCFPHSLFLPRLIFLSCFFIVF
jgi:hypothetical protein